MGHFIQIKLLILLIKHIFNWRKMIKSDILIYQRGFILVYSLKIFTAFNFAAPLCCHFSEVGHIVSPRLICLPPSQPASLHSEGTPGFMASDRKSIERTVCNPTITLSPNEETVIQSLSLYLSKTDFQLYDQECVSLSRSQPVWDLNTVHLSGSSLCFHDSFALICCFSFLLMYSLSSVPLNAGIWL